MTLAEIAERQGKIERIISYTPKEWREKQPGVHRWRLDLWKELNELKEKLLNT